MVIGNDIEDELSARENGTHFLRVDDNLKGKLTAMETYFDFL